MPLYCQQKQVVAPELQTEDALPRRPHIKSAPVDDGVHWPLLPVNAVQALMACGWSIWPCFTQS